MLAARVDRVTEKRVSMGFSKIDLARACGVSHSIIVRIEKGEGTSPKTAKAISEALSMPVLDLFEIKRRVIA